MPSQRRLDLLQSVAAAPLLGATTPLRQRLRAAALEQVRVEGLAQAAFSYRIVALETPVGETLRLAGESLHAPWMIPASGQLTALACAVCTVGPLLAARVTALFREKRASAALALDAVGNELLFAVSRRAQDRILGEARRQGLTVCGELRPGDPGLGLDAQAAVLRLAQAHSVDVSLHGGHTLLPLKSTSMVLGVGIDLPVASWSRCDHCPTRAKCKLLARSVEATT